MKRYSVLLLVLLLCIVLSVACAEGQLLQDEQPPKLVAKTNEAGESIVAEISDAQGGLLEQIKDDGTLVLTDVHHRAIAEEMIVRERLTMAYLSVMDDVHHSDVTCLLHDHHDVKVDINDVLKSLGESIDAHDLIMYELFDVSLPGAEEDALMADGGVLSMTLEVMPYQSVPLIVLFTPDGLNWQVLPFEVVNSKCFALNLSSEGTVALLCNGREQANIGGESQNAERDPLNALDGDSNAASFTPSVVGKFAPGLVGFLGSGGELFIGRISDDDGNVVIEVPDRNYVLSYSVAERKLVLDIMTYEHLDWAYNSILEAGSVGNLYTENVNAEDEADLTLAAGLNEYLKQMGFDLTHEQLVVKDLFEVSAYGDYLHYLYDDTYSLEVTFAANVDPEKPLVIIHSADSEHWHIHDHNDMTINPDGTVTLKLYDLGVVAFLVEAETEVDETGAVQAP